ncbi:type II secretion system protein [Undibacterium fentianense]|uniref:Prepilin-type N-terminal cleavage/methylation domain-containing protein n=1 Tax=Undibacterium fentianense TaxID=2828728 RepID=A0A941E1W4_9BURK|nr:prepilin-type N-terminal cleavage/methylation domain-containing protein [Undibacterium fentianense]MBR7800860.1 prepilin-type N-terminal cleavage/methylation domain-containing protein [Undibacterium fentianense]
MKRFPFASARGFSLLELSVGIVVIGILTVSLVLFIPKIKSLPAFSQHSGNPLDQANKAIEGFVIANSRLPCPDTSPNNIGDEDCSGAAVTGWLPTRTLGITLSEPVRYGVYRQSTALASNDYDLAVLKDRYVPLLPSTYASSYSVKKNGLDFCIGLLNLTGNGGIVLTAGDAIPIAYGLATAGAANADQRDDGVYSKFDGLNVKPGQFELSGAQKTNVYDDDTRTVGSAEFFERLACTQKLAAVNSVGRAAYVAYDVDEVAKFYVKFRTFQVKVAELNNAMVGTAKDLAIADLAISIAGMGVAVAGMFESPGPAGAFGIATAGAAIAMAGYSMAEALKEVPKAAEDLTTARQQKIASDNFKVQTGIDLTTAMTTINTLDGKGIRP